MLADLTGKCYEHCTTGLIQGTLTQRRDLEGSIGWSPATVLLWPRNTQHQHVAVSN